MARRISVVGISGSGTSTLARKLGVTLGLPVLELDALNHQWRSLLAWDPERSVIRWAWTRYHRRRGEVLAAMDDPRWAHVTFVRVPSCVVGDALVAAARR